MGINKWLRFFVNQRWKDHGCITEDDAEEIIDTAFRNGVPIIVNYMTKDGLQTMGLNRDEAEIIVNHDCTIQRKQS